MDTTESAYLNDYDNDANNLKFGVGLGGFQYFAFGLETRGEKEKSTTVTGIKLPTTNDLNQVVQVTLSSVGNLSIKTNVVNGLTSNDITNNHSNNVILTSTISKINRTLETRNGLIYTGALNFLGNDKVTISSDTGYFSLIDVKITGGTKYDQWLVDNFNISDLTNILKKSDVWGEDADPDFDGWKNLHENAFGLNPNTRNLYSIVNCADFNQASTTGGNSTVNPPICQEIIRNSVTGKSNLCLTFIRQKSDDSIEYIPEISTDLKSWNSDGIEEILVEAITNNNEFELATYMVMNSVDTSKEQFVRLKVSSEAAD